MSETIQTILEEVNKHKRCSKATIHGYLKRLKIKPLGSIRQRPQPYPLGTADAIIKTLGLSGNGRLPSLEQLRHERAKARRAA